MAFLRAALTKATSAIMAVCLQTQESETASRDCSCRRLVAVFLSLILYGAFPDSGRTGRELIYGSRKTIFGRDCLFQYVMDRGAFKPARCGCRSLRRMGCNTSGSLLPTCRMEPDRAVRSILLAQLSAEVCAHRGRAGDDRCV